MVLELEATLECGIDVVREVSVMCASDASDA